MNKKFIAGLLFFLVLQLTLVLAVECTDSDGGKNIFVRGNTTGQKWGTGQMVGGAGEEEKWIEPVIETATDYCMTEGEKVGRLVEYSCFKNQVFSQTFGPEDGCIECKDGVCTEIPVNCSVEQCKRNGKCYNLGDRIGTAFGEYCAENEEVKMQLPETSLCKHNYECTDNLCYKGICMQRKSIYFEIVEWLKSLFK